MAATPNLEELTATVAAMAARIAELEGDRGRDAAQRDEQAQTVSRRGLLRYAVAGAGAAVASSAVFGAVPASAATGDNFVLGNANDADATTSLTGSGDVTTVSILNSGVAGAALSAEVTDPTSTGDVVAVTQAGSGSAIRVIGAATSTGDVVTITQAGTGAPLRVVSAGAAPAAAIIAIGASAAGVSALSNTGPAIDGTITNAANSQPVVRATTAGNGTAVFGTANGLGHGLLGKAFGAGYGAYGYTNGTGGAIRALVANASNTRQALLATTYGSGVGVEGGSSKGRGGRFSGKLAQLQLVPGASGSHPASGEAGDVYVDHAKRLWFCRGGSSWVQVV